MRESLQKEMGIVRSTKHYLVSVEGLPSVRVHDMVLSEEGKRGLVTALSHDTVEIMMLDSADVRPGQRFELTENTNQLSVGDHLFGRVMNALGDPIDGGVGFPLKNKKLILTKDAGDLASRTNVVRQLETGFSVIDTTLPIGKGQRQLLMGPIQSGIDAFCKRVIQNQEGKDMVCIYATVGKPATQVKRLAEDLFSGNARKYSFVIASFSDDTAPRNIITPPTALLLAEYFCESGKDVMLIFDDLYTHAKYIRELSLLEGRLPGRESYPGDIFYQQAHLIERAGSFSGKGSITLLPILQTDFEGTTDLITTNIMGTTDGHLSFSAGLYAQGVFPPVSEDESVTRVGRHTQSILQKQLATEIVSLLMQAREQERFTQFGAQISEGAKKTIQRGKIVRAILNQKENENLSVEAQCIILALVFSNFSEGKETLFFKKNYEILCDTAQNSPEILTIRKSVKKEKEDFQSFLNKIQDKVSIFEKACLS
jgi:F-type H+-transporting ATPase subunit alpha